MDERTNHVERDIAKHSFEYGNHTITVSIYLKNRLSAHNCDVMNSGSGAGYYRFVKVKARREIDERPEIKHRSVVKVDVDTSEPNLLFRLLGVERSTVPSIPDHVEYTVRPVLEELQNLYQYTTKDTEIDIDVAMNRVEHERSWVDVDDSVDRISKELNSMAGESDE
jgi:hypothetical protein